MPSSTAMRPPRSAHAADDRPTIRSPSGWCGTPAIWASSARLPQRRIGGRHRGAEAGPPGALARAVLAGRGRRVRAGDPGLLGRCPSSASASATGHRRGAGRAHRARQTQMHGKTDVLHRRWRGVTPGCRGVHRDPLPLAGDRQRHAAPGAGGHRHLGTARSWACATASWLARRRRWRACSSTRVDPLRAWARDAAQLLNLGH